MKEGAKERTASQIAALARDIAAVRAKALGQRALDDVDAVHQALALADAAAARPIQATAWTSSI